MNWLDEARMYARFAAGLRRFLSKTITLEEARAIIRQRLEQRNENFLRIVERAIYGTPRSPYFVMLKQAGCELSDLRVLVEQKGLEGALSSLHAAGVRVSYEEFKGRADNVGAGLERPLTAHDFDNPLSAQHFYSESGGSTGAGTRVPQDLDHYAARAGHQIVALAASGWLDIPLIIWRGILPDGSGFGNVLQAAYMGNASRKWFSQIAPLGTRDGIKFALATYATVGLARLYGAPLPFPRYVPVDRADVIVRAAYDLVRAKGACMVMATVSRAVRASLAAQELGLDLTGVVFAVGGEPNTPAKQQAIQNSGATIYLGYSVTETGRLGHGCANGIDGTDLHLAHDGFALITHPHRIEEIGATVPAFTVTTLMPTAPKIMLNVELDDYGIVEERACGCDLYDLGWTTHLRQIHSFSKLKGEGVTLMGSDMVRILEEVLPRRFGGSALDYQLLEEEDAQGLTRLYLVISPRVVIADEEQVIRTVMDALHNTSVMADAARAIWKQAGSFRIKRMEPIWTARGKLMPLYSEKGGERKRD